MGMGVAVSFTVAGTADDIVPQWAPLLTAVASRFAASVLAAIATKHASEHARRSRDGSDSPGTTALTIVLSLVVLSAVAALTTSLLRMSWLLAREGGTFNKRPSFIAVAAKKFALSVLRLR